MENNSCKFVKNNNTDKLPVHAVGTPCRDPGLNALPGFITPPSGYGEVAFYWWLGDKLTKERIAWQLDQLKDRSISGLQVNYAHSDKGGLSWGLTYPSEPPLFSEEWWELYGWFLEHSVGRYLQGNGKLQRCIAKHSRIPLIL